MICLPKKAYRVSRGQLTFSALLVALVFSGNFTYAANVNVPKDLGETGADELNSIRYRSRLLSYGGRILVAKAQKRLVTHSDPIEAALGGFFLSSQLFGLSDQVAQTLLAEAQTPAGRDKAWFYLGQRYIRYGMGEAAEKAWEKVGRKLPAGLEAKRRLLLARLYFERGETTAANRLLESTNPRTARRGVVLFNRGVGQLLAGQDSRGAKTLLQLSRLSVADEGQQALLDRTYLALGYQFAKSGQKTLAKATLSRISPRGLYARKSLLIQGWVHFSNREYSQALAIWNRLSDGDPSHPAVQEGLLGRASAIEKANDLENALIAYTRALNSYLGQIEILNRAARSVEKGGFIRAMEEWHLASGVPSEDRWILPDIFPANRPELWYMQASLTSHQLSEFYRNYRRHALLKLLIDAWREDIPRLNQILGVSEREYAEEQASRFKYLQEQLGQGVPLSAREWVLGSEYRASGRVHSADLRMQRLLGTPKKSTRKERLRLLDGIAKWKGEKSAIVELQKSPVARQTEVRRRAAEREFQVLEKARLDAVQKQLPAIRAELLSRLSALYADTKKLNPRVKDGLLGQVSRMVQAVRRDLQGQQRRLERNILRVNLAISRIHEMLETREVRR